MSSKQSMTLVVAVYNSVRYLEFIFEALRRQSYTDFEVIIADDGSGKEIQQLIERTQPIMPMPLRHLWQPDVGFRKNVMLNEAIAASQTDYLVFIDGDCIPHHEFVRDHWTYRQANSVLCGRRVNFSKQISDKLTIDDFRSGRFERLSLRLLWDGLMARSSNLEDRIRIESLFIRRLIPRNKARILGCNFSVEKQLLEKINGFDEDYKAPGLGEDSDIAFRLSLIGAQSISLRYLAILYHLYHPSTHVDETNRRLYDDVVRKKNAICLNGLVKLTKHNLLTV